jgi:hypothetical protein
MSVPDFEESRWIGSRRKDYCATQLLALLFALDMEIQATSPCLNSPPSSIAWFNFTVNVDKMLTITPQPFFF